MDLMHMPPCQPICAPILLALGLAGCASQGPIAEYYPIERQKEMFSASHWKLLAAETAAELREAIPGSGPYALHVDQDNQSVFAASFTQFLAIELTHRGIQIADDEPYRVIKVDVQVVKHHSGPPADPFAFTMLGAVSGLGVWIGNAPGIGLANDAVPPVAVATGGLIDLKRSLLPPATATELVVATSVFENGYQTAGKADVFYIQTRNAPEYSATVNPTDDPANTPSRPRTMLPIVGS
jgi:hypothetical protein